jgi:hypothetical protein
MDTFRVLLYAVAILTSLLCTILLWRGYRRRGFRLLLWSAVCFAGLTVNNLILFVDLIVFPDIDLRPWRLAASLVGILAMLWAFLVEEPS